MKKKLLINLFFIFCTGFIPSILFAQVGTNFSEPTAGTSNYIDPNIATHQLSNNSGQPTVEYIYNSNGSSELGFTTKFISTRSSVAGTTGLSDGDLVGIVTGATFTSSSSITLGSGNIYMMEDPDGTIQLEFDQVDLTGTSSPTLTFQYAFRSTSYEAATSGNDRFFIGIKINDSSSIITLLDTDGDGTEGGNNLTGNDLDDGGLVIEGTAQTFTANLTPYIGNKVTLIIEADFDAGSEEVGIDNILFSEGNIVSPNNNPTISIADTILNYTEGEAATQIDATATISDADGDADWNGGTLVAQITANNEAADQLSISDTDGDGTAITVSGTNILANGTDIGDLSVSGGTVTNGTALTITFDSDATNANVQEVLQSLRYRNTFSNPGTSNRIVTITATDTNAGSANDTRTIAVAAAPDVTNVVVPANSTYTTNNNLDFTIIFNENITVNTTGGTPQLAITVGVNTRQATYISGTGTTALLFRYTVQAGDNDTDGIAVGTLNDNNGTLQNGSGTNAILTLNGVGSTSGVLIDTTAPADPLVTVPATAVTVNSATQTISGTHTENGVTVHAYADSNNDGTADNTTSLGSATVNGNAWSFSVNLTSDTANNFVVQAVDGVGNTSNDVDVLTITEDSTNPADPVVTAPASDLTVNSATQTISGTHTENGVTVHAYADSDNDGTADNATSLGSFIVTVNTWSFSVNLTQNTANNFVVLAVDEAGNTSNNIDVPTITDNAIVTWAGTTTNWNTPSNWSTNSVPTASSDVVIPGGLSHYPTVNSAITDVSKIYFQPGATAIFETITNADIEFKRSINSTDWKLVCAPVSGETIENMLSNNSFDQGTTSANKALSFYTNSGASAWDYQTSSSTGTITNGKGIAVKLGAPNLIFNGKMNTGPVSIAISKGDRTDFNLIGNPYTAYVNSSAFLNNFSNIPVLSEQTIWLWNGTKYVTRNLANPIEISPAQGFFIKAGIDGSVSVNTAMLSHQNSDTFMRNSKTSIELIAKSDKNERSTQIFYLNGKTKGFDNGYDSTIFEGYSNSFSLYSQLVSDNQGENYAIQSLPVDDMENIVVPIGLNALAGKKINFSISSKNLPNNTKVYLEDRVNNEFIDITDTNHAVILKNDVNGIGQFYLRTTSQKIDVPIATSIKEVSIYKSATNTLNIVGLQSKNASIKIFSLFGKEVANQSLISNGFSTVNIPSLAAGVYIIELTSKLGKTSKKIILE